MLKAKNKGTKEKQKNKSSSRKKIGLSAVILFLIILILCFGTIITFVTDYWWFKDLGYTQVFFKKLFTELKIGIPAFIIIFALSEVYLRALKKEYLKKLETVPGRASDKSISRMNTYCQCCFFSDTDSDDYHFPVAADPVCHEQYGFQYYRPYFQQ